MENYRVISYLTTGDKHYHGYGLAPGEKVTAYKLQRKLFFNLYLTIDKNYNR